MDTPLGDQHGNDVADVLKAAPFNHPDLQICHNFRLPMPVSMFKCHLASFLQDQVFKLGMSTTGQIKATALGNRGLSCLLLEVFKDGYLSAGISQNIKIRHKYPPSLHRHLML